MARYTKKFEHSNSCLTWGLGFGYSDICYHKDANVYMHYQFSRNKMGLKYYTLVSFNNWNIESSCYFKKMKGDIYIWKIKSTHLHHFFCKRCLDKNLIEYIMWPHHNFSIYPINLPFILTNLISCSITCTISIEFIQQNAWRSG